MEVWSWGAGADGQLATGLLADSLLPQRVPALENTGVREMACGGAHAVAVLGIFVRSVRCLYVHECRLMQHT